MGLLDMIAPGSDGGGFLDFLKRNAMLQQPQAVGLPSDQADYGQSPTPTFISAGAAPSAPPIPQNPPPIIPAQPATAASLAPAMGGGASPGIISGPLNALSHSIMNIPRGGRDDPADIAARQQAQTANMTARMLVQHGYAPADALALVQPGNGAALTEALKQVGNQGQFTQETDKDGNIWSVDKRSGEKKLLLQPKDDAFQNVEVKDSSGNVVGTRTLNKKTGEYGPVQSSGVASGQILGDANKTGAEYIATLPADKRDTVKGMIDGTIQPPTSFAAAKPYWQQMIAAAKHADPKWDENNWAARHKMSVDLASSGNSSMGGILSNGESSFKHLAEYTKSAVDQGNISHNFPLGGAIAHAQNYIGNAGGGSDTQAKVKATNDNLGHYGQESTKFYAGTGGGVEERMNALKEMDATKTSGEESAAYAEKEKGLMLDRLNTKLREIKDTYGEEKGNEVIAKHMPEIQASLKMINKNIDRLRGIKPGSPGSASFGTPVDMPTKEAIGSAVPKLKVGETHDMGGGIAIKKVSE